MQLRLYSLLKADCFLTFLLSLKDVERIRKASLWQLFFVCYLSLYIASSISELAASKAMKLSNPQASFDHQKMMQPSEDRASWLRIFSEEDKDSQSDFGVFSRKGSFFYWREEPLPLFRGNPLLPLKKSRLHHSENFIRFKKRKKSNEDERNAFCFGENDPKSDFSPLSTDEQIEFVGRKSFLRVKKMENLGRGMAGLLSHKLLRKYGKMMAEIDVKLRKRRNSNCEHVILPSSHGFLQKPCFLTFFCLTRATFIGKFTVSPSLSPSQRMLNERRELSQTLCPTSFTSLKSSGLHVQRGSSSSSEPRSGSSIVFSAKFDSSSPTPSDSSSPPSNLSHLSTPPHPSTPQSPQPTKNSPPTPSSPPLNTRNKSLPLHYSSLIDPETHMISSGGSQFVDMFPPGGWGDIEDTESTASPPNIEASMLEDIEDLDVPPPPEFLKKFFTAYKNITRKNREVSPIMHSLIDLIVFNSEEASKRLQILQETPNLGLTPSDIYRMVNQDIRLILHPERVSECFEFLRGFSDRVSRGWKEGGHGEGGGKGASSEEIATESSLDNAVSEGENLGKEFVEEGEDGVLKRLKDENRGSEDELKDKTPPPALSSSTHTPPNSPHTNTSLPSLHTISPPSLQTPPWTNEEISSIIKRNAKLVRCGPQKFANLFKILTDTLHLTESDILSIGRKRPQVFAFGRPDIKFNHLYKLGYFSRTQLTSLCVRWPKILGLNVERCVQLKMLYLLNRLFKKPLDVFEFPQYLSYDLRRRIIPRHAALILKLKSDGIAFKSDGQELAMRPVGVEFPSLQEMLASSDVRFMRLFNISYRMFAQGRIDAEKIRNPQRIF